MILVTFSGTPAALEDLAWVADDWALMQSLNLDADTFRRLDLEAADPDPDTTHAEAMVEKWGGEILRNEPPPDEGNQVY